MRIVVICPFSHEDPAVRMYREREATAYAEHLGEAGHDAMALIEGAELALTEDQGRDVMPFENWQHINDPLILAADQVHLLKLRGYEHSRGVAHELRLATDAGKRVVWVDRRCHGWMIAGREDLPVVEAIAQEETA